MILINNIFYGASPLSFLYNFKLIKNLIGNFETIHVGIMHAKFKASSFTGVRGEWGEGRMRDITPDP